MKDVMGAVRVRKNCQTSRELVLHGDRYVPLAVPVYVQCDGGKRLAYRDSKGVWRDFQTIEALSGPVSIVPFPRV